MENKIVNETFLINEEMQQSLADLSFEQEDQDQFDMLFDGAENVDLSQDKENVKENLKNI